MGGGVPFACTTSTDQPRPFGSSSREHPNSDSHSSAPRSWLKYSILGGDSNSGAKVGSLSALFSSGVVRSIRVGIRLSSFSARRALWR